MAGLALLVCGAALLVACGEETGPDGLPLEVMGPAEARTGRAQAPELRREGERLYALYCTGCHGEKGDGNGPAARFLDPKPRDFTSGLFKYAAVEAGELPRDEDLMRTLRRGLAGSSMPSWQFLPEESRRVLVEYIKIFFPAWREHGPGAPIAVSPDPYGTDDPATIRRAVERGRVVYHAWATCWQCHASYATQAEVSAMSKVEWDEDMELRPDAGQPMVVEDAWGGTLLPPDFTRQRMKSGSSLEDFYRTIAAGVGGTAMPTWKGALEEQDLWALAYYVKSLADQRWRQMHVVPAQPPITMASGHTEVK
ncbi:MAG: c-type cytochrome [Acidobacteriota bacterium]